MSAPTLFPLPVSTAGRPNKYSPGGGPAGAKCRTCGHVTGFAHQPDSYKYCNQRRSNRTPCGLMKVSTRDTACPLYTPRAS